MKRDVKTLRQKWGVKALQWRSEHGNAFREVCTVGQYRYNIIQYDDQTDYCIYENGGMIASRPDAQSAREVVEHRVPARGFAHWNYGTVGTLAHDVLNSWRECTIGLGPKAANLDPRSTALLADALEEAGCVNPPILTQLRRARMTLELLSYLQLLEHQNETRLH